MHKVMMFDRILSNSFVGVEIHDEKNYIVIEHIDATKKMMFEMDEWDKLVEFIQEQVIEHEEEM